MVECCGSPPGNRPRIGSKEFSMASIYDLVKDRRVYSIEADRTVLEAARFMMEHSIGALPVLRNGELAGLFSGRGIMKRVGGAGRLAGNHKICGGITPDPK